MSAHDSEHFISFLAVLNLLRFQLVSCSRYFFDKQKNMSWSFVVVI